jgi:hypothetical protein
MPNRLRGGATGAALSYVDTKYNSPSASAGSNIQISEPGLVRPVLNPTGGKRSYKRSYRRSHKRRSYKRTNKRNSRRGGFHPSVMGNFIGNASRLVPAAAITGYRMLKNYNKTRRNRK